MEEKQRISDQLANELRSRIIGGEFPPGSRLPSERKLAEDHGVNRAGVREALKVLEKDKLVRIQHGGGAIVTEFWRVGGLDLLATMLSIGGRLDLELLDHLLESRRVFCREVTRLAVPLLDDDVLDDLRAIQDEASAHKRDVDRLQRLDFAFFYRLALASGNRVLRLMMNNVRPLYLSYQGIFRALYWDLDDYLARRQEILEALERRDTKRATEMVDALLRVSMTIVTRSSA